MYSFGTVASIRWLLDDILKKIAKKSEETIFMELIIKTAELSIKTAELSIKTAELILIPRNKH